MEFVGQKSLLATLNRYTVATLPHSILLLGPSGCGKKTMAKYLASRLGLDFLDISNRLSTDDLQEFRQSPLKRIYAIDLSKLGLEKDQNRLLKFIEEPGNNAYIVLLGESEIGVMQTVLNRCVKVRFDRYSVDELKNIKPFADDWAYVICDTPGKLRGLDESTFQKLRELCRSITCNAKAAPYANMMSVCVRINCKDDYDKFDFAVFFAALRQTAYEAYLDDVQQAAVVYEYTSRRLQEFAQNQGIAKEAFVASFFDGLWRLTR